MIPLDSLTIGYLILDDSLGFPSLKINKFGGFTKFLFHVFDRSEINIQAFGDIFYGAFIIFESSYPQNYIEIYILILIHKNEMLIISKKKMVSRTHDFQTFSIFESHIYKNNIFQDVPIFFLVSFEAFFIIR